VIFHGKIWSLREKWLRRKRWSSEKKNSRSRLCPNAEVKRMGTKIRKKGRMNHISLHRGGRREKSTMEERV